MKTITPLINSLLLLTSFNFSAIAQTYCTSKGISTSHGYIKKVSMETINNTTGNIGGYTDFTSQSATLQRGATYTIELTPGFISGAAFFEYWTVYIDYNQNGVFEANEVVAKGHNAIRINKSFPIPSTSLKGATGMRIQMQEGAQETNPCANYNYGDVQDYTVILADNVMSSIGINSDFKNSITDKRVTDLKLFPNPANESLTVGYTSNEDGHSQVNIYNLTGQKVMNIENPSGKGLTYFTINTSKLTPGFYILEINNNGQTQHQKFLVAK
jgi:GEVED domain/Secretion system C-terminal sorting domain